MGENIAIRDAYGAALKELGEQNEKIVGLEADVASSTKAEFLERHFRNVTLMWASASWIWYPCQPDLPGRD